MCKIMEDIVNEEKREDRIKLLTNMINDGVSKEKILQYGFTEDEYEETEKELLAKFN